MKIQIAFDTSALISLGHTGLIDTIINQYEILITNRIHEELIDISQWDDANGQSAKDWLEHIDEISIEKAKRKKVGEDELLEICLKQNVPMVIDDLKALKRFGNDIDWIFSSHIIYLLCKKQLISKQRGLVSLEKMIHQRDWKDNVIAVTGRTLFR